MTRPVDFFRNRLPNSVRQFLGARRRNRVFRRAMKAFIRAPESSIQPGNTLIADLVYGWMNEWSAREAYLVCCIQHALQAEHAILECGSGLSTLLVGTVAQARGCQHCVLENSEEWAEKVRLALHSYRIDVVSIQTNPLKDYGDYCWYDPAWQSMPERFGLVICDGPPGLTKGGRYGLGAVMKNRFAPGCTILLDDGERNEEQAIADRWATELGASYEILGQEKPYIRMTLNREDSDRQT